MWDTKTGEHSLRPLVDDKGKAWDFTSDDLAGFDSGRLEGTTYVWVDRCCSEGPVRVFETELTTGVTTKRFDVPGVYTDSHYKIAKNHLFVLEADPDRRDPVRLYRYNLATGERSTILTIPHTTSVNNGYTLTMMDFAMDPEWLEKQDAVP